MSPEKLWDNFIKHLNTVKPLVLHGEKLPHHIFLGSIDSYRKVFLEANPPEKTS